MDTPPVNVIFKKNAAEVIASVIPTIASGIGSYKYFGNTPETAPEEPPQEPQKEEE